MSKNDYQNSVSAYLDEVGGILADLPTPTINAAVMRGAEVRFTSPGEGIPGPRRLILDGITGRCPLATGVTATALLARQRRNLVYLDEQRTNLADDENRADDEVCAPAVEELEDHAAEVLDILRALPLLPGDFSGVFEELASLAGLEQHGGCWEICVPGDHAHVALESLGEGFALDALKARTAANAARLRRWRAAFHCDDEPAGGGLSNAPSRSERSTRLPTFVAEVPSGLAADEQHNRAVGEATRRHHDRTLARDELLKRRRRFPELFVGMAATSLGRVSNDVLAERRRRFPELFGGQSPASTNPQPGEDGIELC